MIDDCKLMIEDFETVVRWSAEDQAFVVFVPKLPGCMAHGRTRVSAVQRTREAIAFWLETAREDGILK
jgi:predicted RNase H-like HicB family nuclease